MSELWSFLGATGSLLGAGFAWAQFIKAKSSADKAENVELRLTTLLQQREMVKEIQKIKTLVQKLGNYARPGTNANRMGLNLERDIEDVMQFRNEFKSTSSHSEIFKEPLDGILEIITSVNFKKSDENDRITAIKGLLEYLNEIAVEIDKEVKKDD
jgi:hypothetical protein